MRPHIVRGIVATVATLANPSFASTITASDSLSADASRCGLSRVALDGRVLAGVALDLRIEEPRERRPVTAGFEISGRWEAADGYLKLTGAVTASGSEDIAGDLIVRVRGAQLALGAMPDDPLLQPRRLLSKLPVVNLRIAGQDQLALAVPPTDLAIFDFRQVAGAVELRYCFGFTNEAKPALKMRAPFACILYRSDPQWHYRSALARYYAFFPSPFKAFVRKQGGWFFAAPTKDLPNPQHFHYHEGGPWGWELDEERGMGTYPYRESSSYTIRLSGDRLPASYEEAMERFDALGRKTVLANWTPQQSYTVDAKLKHSGRRSLLADSGTTGVWTGARQVILLDPAVTKPLLVKGFSRAEGVSGTPDHNYSVYVDVCYDDGTYLFGQCAVFRTGTHDWQEARQFIEPTRPVRELRVYCLLRGHRGKAWFDDVHVGPADNAEANWLANAGFEEDERDGRFEYVRDNVYHDSRGQYVVRITDNVSADVKPKQPLNLLRFTLNVDPDVPSIAKHPAVAAKEIQHFDRLLREYPALAGCYIDSVSSWCARVLNYRRDHWRYNDFPFTYEPGSFKVAPHGRFAMVEYLRALQNRYHPLGKAIFTNIHVNRDAFPIYLVSDVPGIESSLFHSEEDLFFYRACSFQKPLLLLNFMNLHGLDKREIAEAYHLNAAQWGEFPSTGRFVERAYREYGDVTHAYLPTIKELSAAGWQPIPLASGTRAERFGEEGAVYFTVRAPREACQEILCIQHEALARLSGTPVALDAVWLSELPIERNGDDYVFRVTHGDRQLTVVRLSSREDTARWLVDRARRHGANASRVQGAAGETPQIRALAAKLAAPPATSETGLLAQIGAWRTAIQSALGSVKPDADDLFALSQRRELLQADRALVALAAFTVRAKLAITGDRLAYVGQPVELNAAATASPGTKVRLVRLESAPGRCIVPDFAPTGAAPPPPRPVLRVESRRPGVQHVRAVFEVGAPSLAPVLIERLTHVFFLPPASITIRDGKGTEDKRKFEAKVGRKQPELRLTLQATIAPPAEVVPVATHLGPDQDRVVLHVKRHPDGLSRTLTVLAADDKGSELARAETTYWDEPSAPTKDLALASRGARCTTESNYPGGYSPGPIIDGATARTNRHWTQQAWASMDSSQPHWLQIDLPQACSVREVWIYWAIDSRRTHTSRQYAIIGLTDAGREELLAVDSQPIRTVSRHQIAPTTVRGIRIEQPANRGVATRPGIMWIREVCLMP